MKLTPWLMKASIWLFCFWTFRSPSWTLTFMPKPAPCAAHSSPQYLISGCESVSSTTPTFIPLVSTISPLGAAFTALTTRLDVVTPVPATRAPVKNWRR